MKYPSLLTGLLLAYAAAAHAQPFPPGPMIRDQAVARCSAGETGCSDKGTIPIVFPKPVAASCGVPAPGEGMVPADFARHSGVKIFVDANGSVLDARVIHSSGYPHLDAAVVAAARSCKFEPGTRGDVPTAVASYWFHRWANPPVMSAASAGQDSPPQTITTTNIPTFCPTMVPPEFPRRAIREGIEGEVTARMTIANGIVSNISGLYGPDVYYGSVIEALARYRCKVSTSPVTASQQFVFKIEDEKRRSAP